MSKDGADAIGGVFTFFMAIICCLLIYIGITRYDISSQKTFIQGNSVYQCKRINQLVSER